MQENRLLSPLQLTPASHIVVPSAVKEGIGQPIKSHKKLENCLIGTSRHLKGGRV